MVGIVNEINERGSFISTSDMKSRSEYRKVLRAVQRGELTKVRHGVYASPDEMLDTMIDIEKIVLGGESSACITPGHIMGSQPMFHPNSA